IPVVPLEEIVEGLPVAPFGLGRGQRVQTSAFSALVDSRWATINSVVMVHLCGPTERSAGKSGLREGALPQVIPDPSRSAIGRSSQVQVLHRPPWNQQLTDFHRQTTVANR